MNCPDLEALVAQYPASGYLRFHLPRYRHLFGAIAGRYRPGMALLDVGISPFTDCLRNRFNHVDTLGFGQDQTAEQGNHYAFDLNLASDVSRWRNDLPRYDLVVFAEVLEHLYTAPSQVLGFLRSLLHDDGLLFIQTPNAVALNKRLRMLLGSNPYELIRENADNPGHYREYTRRELFTYLHDGGWKLEHFSYENYFDHRYVNHDDCSDTFAQPLRQIHNALFAVMPGPLKPGMFLIARPDQASLYGQ